MKLRSLTLALLTLAAAQVFAGSVSIAEPAADKPASIYDKLWSLATVYKNPENPLIEEISFFGRAHTNWAAVESNKGDWSDWEERRLRAGVRVKFLNDFDLKVETRYIAQGRSAYTGLTEASITWNADNAFRLTVGKQLPRFTLEGSISANELITVERSFLANTFWFGEENFSTGISATGDIGNWHYYVATLSGESNKDFGKLNAGFYTVASLGYDFASALHVDRALLQLDYIYNNGDSGNFVPKPFNHTVSLSFDGRSGRYGFQTNVVGASGLGKQPDAWGFILMPTYSLTPKLELVARYTYLDGNGPSAFRPQRRYENEVAGINGTRGDGYQAGYLGLNYYIYGHKLKLQTGIEYSHMSDSTGGNGSFNAWSYISGFRFSF